MSIQQLLRCLVFSDGTTATRLIELLQERVVGLVYAPLNIVAPSHLPARFSHRISLFQQPLRKEPGFVEFVERVRDLDPDVIVCFSYSRIIPNEILQLARLDAVNIHGGLLPEFRGANILNWVLIEGHATTGVTMHELVETVDGGGITFRDEVPISPVDTALTLRDRLTDVGMLQLAQAVKVWDTGRALHKVPQDEFRAKNYQRRRPEDGLVDCHTSNIDVYNMIRGLVSPWPGARYKNCQGDQTILDSFVMLDQVPRLRRNLCPNCHVGEGSWGV